MDGKLVLPSSGECLCRKTVFYLFDTIWNVDDQDLEIVNWLLSIPVLGDVQCEFQPNQWIIIDQCDFFQILNKENQLLI